MEKKYKERARLLPQDMMRFAKLFTKQLEENLNFSFFFSRAFLKLSSSPEAFLILRSHFVTSHATLSICHYVLGIGDRHLSNFMLDLETGGAVGIDFGHAFGTATQVSIILTIISFLACCFLFFFFSVMIVSLLVSASSVSHLSFL